MKLEFIEVLARNDGAVEEVYLIFMFKLYCVLYFVICVLETI